MVKSKSTVHLVSTKLLQFFTVKLGYLYILTLWDHKICSLKLYNREDYCSKLTIWDQKFDFHLLVIAVISL
jgi:hypothetical protein